MDLVSKGRQKISKLSNTIELYTSSTKQGYKSLYCQIGVNSIMKLMTHFMLEEKANKVLNDVIGCGKNSTAYNGKEQLLSCAPWKIFPFR